MKSYYVEKSYNSIIHYEKMTMIFALLKKIYFFENYFYHYMFPFRSCNFHLKHFFMSFIFFKTFEVIYKENGINQL